MNVNPSGKVQSEVGGVDEGGVVGGGGLVGREGGKQYIANGCV